MYIEIKLVIKKKKVFLVLIIYGIHPAITPCIDRITQCYGQCLVHLPDVQMNYSIIIFTSFTQWRHGLNERYAAKFVKNSLFCDILLQDDQNT